MAFCAFAVAILLVTGAEAAPASPSGSSAPPPIPDPVSIPPVAWTAFNDFMHCVDAGHPALAGKHRVICGVEVGQDELKCLRQRTNVQAEIKNPAMFPRRTLYGFIATCPSSNRPNSVGVQIEKLRNGQWHFSVQRLVEIIRRK